MCLSGPGSPAGPHHWLLLREVASTTIRHIGAHTQAQSYPVSVYACACNECAWIEQIFPRQFAIPGHMEAHSVQGNVQRTYRQPSNAVDLCCCLCCTGLSFPRVESCTPNTGWVAHRDHWPLEDDTWPPFFSSPPSLRPDTNALLIGLCFTTSVAPLSACRGSSLINWLGKSHFKNRIKVACTKTLWCLPKNGFQLWKLKKFHYELTCRERFFL